ncbi:hypothetical protein D3C72_2561920 [compost metagenome]
MGQMHADLVRPAGLQLGFQQGKAGKRLDPVEYRVRGQPVRLYPHASLAVGRGVLI